MYSDTTIEDIKLFILNWNNRYPIDHWWRQKYEVAFNSSEHRVSSFIDQLIDYEEDKLYKEYIDRLKKELEDENNEDIPKKRPYKPGIGNFLGRNEVTLTKKEIDEAFDNLNLDNIKLD